MRQFFKRLLLPIALVAVTQTSIVSAESIRLIGPSGEVQSSPQFSSDIVRNSSSRNEPSRVIGPTSNSDTLWSIATRIRPSTQVSVQQTLLAIYRLNPQAFENQNIHSLLPGSTLRIPSLEQVSSVSTQEAVNVMAAHQARLNQQPSVNTSPSVKQEVVSTPVKPEAPKAEQTSETSVVAKPEPVPALEKTTPSEATGSDSEIQALEEKNHRLRLMLAEVQTEVSGLKQELGDENRIRSEVEKLLAEERMKREENQRLAPSQLDQLLSNGWVVAGLALIPGLLIALLVMLFLGRRSSSNTQQDISQTPMNAVPDASVAPIIPAEQSLDDLDEELLLDDDLFGSMDDGESLFAEDNDKQEEDKQEEQPNLSEDENFGFDDADLDFDLEGEDGEDLFAAIDDSGDLDTDFTDSLSSSSGISVSGEEKALGLEEMERALDEVSENDDEDDDVGFDLSDDGDMSQEDIETLLTSDEDSEELESPTLDQSLLDELFSQQDDDDDTEDLLNFDSLLDDDSEAGEDSKTEGDDNLATSFASDEELDDLFANIEAQADLDQLEANSKDESALLEEPLDDSLFDLEDTALLDELVTNDTLENELDATDDDIMSELDELLDESEQSGIPEFDENSTDLLDEFVGELSEDPEGYDSFLSETEDEQEKDEGLELFDELLDIEKSSSEQDQDFNSKNFIDDLINNAPESDPLLDEDDFDLSSDLDESFTDDEFDFNPEIEGLDKESDVDTLVESSEVSEEAKSESASTDVPEEVIANEFGIPQDDDWVFDEEDALADSETVAEAPEAATEEQLSVEELQQPEEDVTAEEANDESADIAAEFDDVELPEYTEEDALADLETVAEAPEVAAEEQLSVEGPQQPEEDVTAEEASDESEDIAADFDDVEFPEYTEEDALADSETVAEAPEAVAEEQLSVEEPQQPEENVTAEEANDESEDIAAEFDDVELPEYTEEDALADSDAVTGENDAPVAEDALVEFDDLDLPEYTEDDALVDSEIVEQDSDDEELVAKNEVNLTDIAKQEFDEQALSDWLSEDDEQSASFDFDKPIDPQSIDSAGMDIEAMLEVGGEDWNGFNLTPDQQATISDEVPEAERDVWQPENQVQEPEVAEENWGSQDVFEEFDPSTSQFMTIDELMAQTELDDGESLNLDEEELKLDVGLNEFPDVIGDVSDFDVDNNAEAASKLDLAKIYIEMNDDKGAIKLLEEAIVDGSDDIRQQAKHLIDVINGRA